MVIDRLFRALEWVGAISLFLVMSLTVVDIVGRYMLNSPLPGSIELTRIGIAIVVFCALQSLTARRGHVLFGLGDSHPDELLTQFVVGLALYFPLH